MIVPTRCPRGRECSSIHRLSGHEVHRRVPPADATIVSSRADTSAGTGTGRARVLTDRADIVTPERGDLLVCHATEPGRTPAFFVIGGLVVQTGGWPRTVCGLSWEDNAPAVVGPEAVRRLPTAPGSPSKETPDR